jgi:hypothetical protein
MRLPRLLILTLFAVALLAPAQAEARAKIAFSDNAIATLKDPRFQATGIKQIRKNVPFDTVANGGQALTDLDAWFATAKAQGIQPLVSFYKSKRGRRFLPSVASYRNHFRAFRARYPWVRTFSTFNEANFPDAQPTGNNPKRTAQFYRAARKECSGGRCTVLTMDFRADGSKHSLRWLKTFKRYMGKGPHTWGLVSHPDINRSSFKRTKEFLKNTRGNVWAVEAGAVNYFGKGFRPSIKRQTKSARFMMTRYLKVSRRLKRMYVYHWRAAKQDIWDSGLLNPNGTPRPAYFIFFKALHKPAP